MPRPKTSLQARKPVKLDAELAFGEISGLSAALQHAERDFESRFGYPRRRDWTIAIADPWTTVCLQAVDYFLWAVQRFYEQRRDGRTGDVRPREDRFLNLLWPQIAEIHDLNHGPSIGTYFGPQRPLKIDVRFPEKSSRKRRKP